MGECWELEDGDTGEAIWPVEACAMPTPRQFVDEWAEHSDAERLEAAEVIIDAVRGAAVSREVEAARGLPEYLDDMKWQLAYWEWLAKFGRRKRIWRSGWDRWGFKWYAGGDEFGRHTVVVGPWVIALWSCRCDDCKADERALLDIIDREV